MSSINFVKLKTEDDWYEAVQKIMQPYEDNPSIDEYGLLVRAFMEAVADTATECASLAHSLGQHIVAARIRKSYGLKK
jgi:hypothetical protein